MPYTAEVSDGGGDLPDIEDGTYDAMIQVVSEEWEEANHFKKTDKDPDMVTRQYLTWELTDNNAPEGVTVRQYLTIPPGLQKGFLNKKSNVFATMEVLFGTEYMNGKFSVDIPGWQGMEARVTLKTPRENGKPTGWPKVTDVLAKRRQRPQATPASRPTRQPVAVGAADDDWDDK